MGSWVLNFFVEEEYGMQEIFYYCRNVIAGFFIVVVPIWLMCHGISKRLIKDSRLVKEDLYRKQEYFADKAVGWICILNVVAIFIAVLSKSVFFNFTLLQMTTVGVLLFGFGLRLLFLSWAPYYR